MNTTAQILQIAIASILGAGRRAVRYMDKLSIDEFQGVGAPYYGHVEKGTLVIDYWSALKTKDVSTLVSLLRQSGLQVRKGAAYDL